MTGAISPPTCGAKPGTPSEYLALRPDRLSVARAVLPGARTSYIRILPSRPAVAMTVDVVAGSMDPPRGSKKVQDFNEAVCPVRVAMRVGVGPSRACNRAVASPDAVS
jgi:hypothetical protein